MSAKTLVSGLLDKGYTSVSRLSEGHPERWEGVSRLADGIQKSADGSKHLADGTTRGLAKDATQVPSYTTEDRTQRSRAACRGGWTRFRPLSPLSPAYDAVRAVVTGGPGATSGVFALVGWTLLGALFSVVAILRARTVSPAALAAVS
ncbi:MAG: hypothetical protein ACYC1E_09905 [Propionibacteriaceae bacterium]